MELSMKDDTYFLPVNQAHYVLQPSILETIKREIIEDQEKNDAKETILEEIEKPSVESEEKEKNQINEKPIVQPDNSLRGYLNDYVLEVIKTYNYRERSYPYLLNKDYDNYNGVTATLHYKNQVLLKAHPSGSRASHCSGITFEVFFKAMQERNQQLGISVDDFNGMTWDELYDFVLTWYAALGPKTQSNIAIAVEKYGIGQQIKRLEDAKPGDFIDISRENNTGHTAVFLGWIKEENRIIGFEYWSSQDSTNGISYHKEYFNVTGAHGRKYGNVRIDKVYIARILPVSQYRAFK